MVWRSTGSGAILPVDMIRYGGDTTSAALVQYGVPQGSVIGPLLFVLYTSDVPRVINECGLLSVVYADDTQIYIQIKQRNIPVAKIRAGDCIAKVKQWLVSNRLRLNPSKGRKQCGALPRVVAPHSTNRHSSLTRSSLSRRSAFTIWASYFEPICSRRSRQSYAAANTISVNSVDDDNR